jgi:uncharacterized protein (TIGR00269 family)
MKIRLRNPDRELELEGPKQVRELLSQLEIDPDTVLVIRDRTLLTREERLSAADEVEIRPVISGGSPMKCKRCGGAAAIEVRRHNAAFCRDCLIHHAREAVKRSIHSFRMLEPDDRILVAVSGGKDSLALWDILLDLEYRATGLYLGLGIGEYSNASAQKVRAFAADRDVELIEVDLQAEHGFDIPTAGRKGSRSTCAVCGLSKRYIFNRVALERGFDVVATGHNLDDEAATLLGNTLRWQTEYIARQYPVLPQRDGMVKKVKPLIRLSELETAAYAFLRDIDYQVEECPLVAGNTQLRYKQTMNLLESNSPGTKTQFFLGYLDRAAELFRPMTGAQDLTPCERCDQPTTGRFCAFCRARAQVLGERLIAAELEDRDIVREIADEVLPTDVYGTEGARAG